MITIIAEKPAVAFEIARIVGARKREDGFMSGNGYAVTWAYGHLVEIFSDGDDDWEKPLPFLPEAFRLRVGQSRGKDGKMHADAGYLKQLKIIDKLFRESEYIINAGDAGREGELIQRYIYRYVGAKAPVKRLWTSSLSDEALKAALADLHPSSEYDNLYLAGKARNEADWLVGINATRAMTKVASHGDGVKSLGRVQTPTLALVCRRFIENRDFVPESFWRIEATALLGSDSFTVKSDEKYSSEQKGYNNLVLVQQCGRLSVDDLERKEEKRQPPLLYDLTALQRDANKRYSMTAQETLNAAQSLYEKKLITYPRTGSRYITDDVFRTIPGLLQRIAAHNPKSSALALSKGTLNRHSVNPSKVTDHHALLPTGLEPSAVSDNARKVYDLILTRFFEALSPACEMIATRVHLTCEGIGFTARGNVVVVPGWRAVRGEKPAEKDENGEDLLQNLPAFHDGDVCPVKESSLTEGQTKPKPIFTEDTLLEAMKYAGREVVDEDLKEAIKDCGLGTPATRAAEIETIVRRGYIERRGKQLIPTSTGLSIYEAVKDKSIADVEMTANWEMTLAKIAEGNSDPAEFDRKIREYTTTIVGEILSNDSVGSAVLDAETVEGATCPMCGKAVMLTTRLARCVDDNCGWKIWRTISGRNLSEQEMKSLLGEGCTKELKGFKSKAGKSFNAALRMDEEGRLSFEFIDHSKDSEGNDLKCPKCSGAIKVLPNMAICQDEECGWRLWRTIAGKTVTDTMLQALLQKGSTAIIKGFRSKTGKTFNASLKLNGNGEVEFRFPEGPAKGMKKWK